MRSYIHTKESRRVFLIFYKLLVKLIWVDHFICLPLNLFLLIGVALATFQTYGKHPVLILEFQNLYYCISNIRSY